MKTTHNPSRKRAKSSASPKHNLSHRLEAAVFAGLGLTAFMAVFLAAWTVFTPLRSTRRLSVVQYIQSGQWRADVRTVVAEARYILDWGGDLPPDNHLPPDKHLPRTFIATNSAAGASGVLTPG